MTSFQRLGPDHFQTRLPIPKNWERRHGAALRSGAGAERARKMGAGSPKNWYVDDIHYLWSGAEKQFDKLLF